MMTVSLINCSILKNTNKCLTVSANHTASSYPKWVLCFSTT